ncbi:MAG: hypothetical protein DRQ88_01135 [Epsilonproteobacteria bacterium]|nr:MAG: hypothetical protein DRQ88_01135 [Campylobacterota bacterium]
MAKLLINENGGIIRDFISPIKEISEFSTLEINSYVEGETSNEEVGLIVEYGEDIGDIKKSGPILLAYNPSETDISKLEQFLKENPEIYGPLDLDKSLQLQIPVIREFLKTLKKTLELKGLEQKVNKLRKETKSQLDIIKKTFEKMVPVRSSKNNGINVYVKFASGSSQGGEFFDIVNISMQTLILWNRSNTYQGSNNFLDSFQAFESKSYVLEVLEKFIRDLKPEEGQEVFLGQIDLKTLTFSGFNISNSFFYFEDDKKIPNSSFETLRPFSVRLKRGERFLILSSGAMESLRELNPDLNLKVKLDESSLLSPREVLDEIFFELKRNSKKKFLPNDCVIILVEVDKNVIFQV